MMISSLCENASRHTGRSARVMETVHIYSLKGLRPGYQARLSPAQMEAAGVWMVCRDLHLAARKFHTRWPKRDELQKATKDRFALHRETRADDLPHLPW